MWYLGWNSEQVGVSNTKPVKRPSGSPAAGAGHLDQQSLEAPRTHLRISLLQELINIHAWTSSLSELQEPISVETPLLNLILYISFLLVPNKVLNPNHSISLGLFISPRAMNTSITMKIFPSMVLTIIVRHEE